MSSKFQSTNNQKIGLDNSWNEAVIVNIYYLWDRKSAVENSDFAILNMVHIQFHAHLKIMCYWCDLNLGYTSKYNLVTPPLPYNAIYIWWKRNWNRSLWVLNKSAKISILFLVSVGFSLVGKSSWKNLEAANPHVGKSH